MHPLDLVLKCLQFSPRRIQRRTLNGPKPGDEFEAKGRKRRPAALLTADLARRHGLSKNAMHLFHENPGPAIRHPHGPPRCRYGTVRSNVFKKLDLPGTYPSAGIETYPHA